MSALEQDLTHQADAVARLVSQYKGKANMEAFAGVFGARAQDIEDALWLLVTERTLDSAVGVQLDGIGAKVGEDRQGKLDAAYRVFIRARILVNLSSGTVPQLQTIFDLLYSALGGNAVEIAEYFPAALELVAHDATSSANAQALSNILRAARSGGVETVFAWSGALDSLTFTFCPHAETVGAAWNDHNAPTTTAVDAAWPATGDVVVVDEVTGEACYRHFSSRTSASLTFTVAIPHTMTGVLVFSLLSTTQGFAGPVVLGNGSDQHGATTWWADGAFDVAALFESEGSAILTNASTGEEFEVTYQLATTHTLSNLDPSVPATWTGDIYAVPLSGGHLAGCLES